MNVKPTQRFLARAGLDPAIDYSRLVNDIESTAIASFCDSDGKLADFMFDVYDAVMHDMGHLVKSANDEDSM